MSIGIETHGMSRGIVPMDKLSRESTQNEQEASAGFVSPADLERDASQHDTSSHDTKAWLVSFGNLKHGTSVSQRFRIDEQDYPSDPPHSMLPFLMRQTRLWFDQSINDSQERTNTSWMLQYISDYVCLGHCTLDDGEIHDLFATLLYVCNNARHYVHLEGCLLIFLSVAQVEQFPPKCLEEVLTVLSSAIVILDKPLSRIGDCVLLLASGSLAERTVAVLCSQLTIFPGAQVDKEVEPEGKKTTQVTTARGAVRHLVTLLATQPPNEKYVIDIATLLETLKQAALAKFLRLATEILTLLAVLLQTPRAQDLLKHEALITTLLDIFDLCKAATAVPDLAKGKLIKDKITGETWVDRELRYAREHQRAVANARGAVAAVLPVMSTANADRSWVEIKSGLESLSARNRAGAVQYITSHQLCMPGKSLHWYRELLFLIDRVVVNSSANSDFDIEQRLQGNAKVDDNLLEEQAALRTAQRIDILRLCAQSLNRLVSESFDTIHDLPPDQSPPQAGVGALSRLLPIFGTESNNEVVRALLDSLVSLCETRTETGLQPYATIIIQTLRDIILSNAPSDNTADGVYCAGTEALRSIFLRSLGTSTNVAQIAYDTLLNIASYQQCRSRRCRLAAMSLLFRIRCDTAGTIYIDRSSESAIVAGALCKSNESLTAMFSESDVDQDDLQQRSRKVFKKQLWMYPQEEESAKGWKVSEASVIRIEGQNTVPADNHIKIKDWVWVVFANLQKDDDWETYSYSIVHFGTQLSNTRLFEYSQENLAQLRGFLAGRVRDRKLMFAPPTDIGLDQTDVALCIYFILTRLIPYAKMQPPSIESVSSRRGVDLVRAFRAGMASDYEGTARSCIHALSICCFETPDAIGTEYPAIIQAMAQKVTQSHLLVHILEFLAQVARLPYLHEHFMETEIKQIFGICITALKALRSTDTPKHTPASSMKRASAPARGRGLLTPYRAAMMKEKGLTQYSSALAYHTMIFWFLSIPVSRRHEYIRYIIPSLIWTDSTGHEVIDQQTIVLIDLMQRTAFSDLPETAKDESFTGDAFEANSYVDGNCIITIETHRTSGRSQITKRQASGTTYAIYNPLVQPLTPHHDRAFRDLPDRARPSHTLLNILGSAIPIASSEQPLKLNPKEAYVSRALRQIDLITTVDSHKIGVTLLKNGQSDESGYLANVVGTPSFEAFLGAIGTRVSLTPPCPFTPFGLQDGLDGAETVAWRDRINEIVFEVSTMMPNVDGDEYQTRKKSHLGNCLVLIVFNQSNRPWQWEYFQSQVALVNIVITPVNTVSNEESTDDYDHKYFSVEVLTKEEYQNISAAAETKVVSKATLPHLVRMLALNANIFSECARNESTGDAEFPSSWRSRLREIMTLRERTQQRVHDNEDTLAKRYDFNRWT